MAQATKAIASGQAYRLGAFCLFLAIGVILGALAFEHIGGYLPCPLCLQQRYAYYAGIPLLFGALVLLSLERRDGAAVLFFLISLIFLANAAFGVYHAGAELEFWDPPTTCGGALQPLTGGTGGLLNALKDQNPVNCGKPALIILGLSLAGWNAVVCVVLSIASLKAAFEARAGA